VESKKERKLEMTSQLPCGNLQGKCAADIVAEKKDLKCIYRIKTSLNLILFSKEMFNPLKTKRRLLYLKTQSVPRC